jgi:hypothetical protein
MYSHKMQQVLDPSIFKCFQFEFSTALMILILQVGSTWFLSRHPQRLRMHVKRRVLYLHTSAYISSCFLSRHSAPRMHVKRRVLYLHTSAAASSLVTPSASATTRAYFTYIRQHTSAAASSRVTQRLRMHVKRRALYLHTSAAASSLVTPSASACMRNDAYSTYTYTRQHTSAAASSRVISSCFISPSASACM